MPSTTPKDYVTLSARVPRTLVEAVTRYASQHRFPVSELIRDGLEWRIEQDTPGRTRTPSTPDSDQDTSAHPHVIHVLQGWLPVLQDTIRQTLQDVRQDVRHAVSHEAGQWKAPSKAQGADHGQDLGENQQEAKAGTAPSFDPKKFCLGKLCKRGHDYQGTGKSLLRKHNNGCPVCLNALKREKRAQQKAAHPERKAAQI